MKTFFKKYWLKIVIGFAVVFGTLLIFRFFSGNDKLKTKLKEVADESRKKVVEIDTKKKLEQIEIRVELEENLKRKVVLKRSLVLIKKIPDRKKRLESLIAFHKRIRK